ncbi:hypothetical protein CLV40_111193 [Actinokineospora auranticolor]|uniref:Uncharacterized protein n=1 Tax=Actinokineospora auranticolor TaxID=155976 RepID=A0A2S6GLW3_9PSEU|nr:hypothetical protein CLV40_111193 [Actinokineospora auranticolor]
MAPPSTRAVVTAVVGVVVVVGGLLALLWLLVDGGTVRANAQVELARIGVTALLGPGVLFGLYLAWRRQRSTEIGLAQKERDQADVARAYALQREIFDTTRQHRKRVAAATEADAPVLPTSTPRRSSNLAPTKPSCGWVGFTPLDASPRTTPSSGRPRPTRPPSGKARPCATVTPVVRRRLPSASSNAAGPVRSPTSPPRWASRASAPPSGAIVIAVSARPGWSTASALRAGTVRGRPAASPWKTVTARGSCPDE